MKGIIKHLPIITAFLAIGLLLGVVLEMNNVKSFDDLTMEEKRAELVSEKESIIHGLIHEGNYKCCLEKPCTYCIEKTPGHGEGATCSCLADVVNGVHPCGECIGEILFCFFRHSR